MVSSRTNNSNIEISPEMQQVQVGFEGYRTAELRYSIVLLVAIHRSPLLQLNISISWNGYNNDHKLDTTTAH